MSLPGTIAEATEYLLAHVEQGDVVITLGAGEASGHC